MPEPRVHERGGRRARRTRLARSVRSSLPTTSCLASRQRARRTCRTAAEPPAITYDDGPHPDDRVRGRRDADDGGSRHAGRHPDHDVTSTSTSTARPPRRRRRRPLGRQRRQRLPVRQREPARRSTSGTRTGRRAATTGPSSVSPPRRLRPSRRTSARPARRQERDARRSRAGRDSTPATDHRSAGDLRDATVTAVNGDTLTLASRLQVRARSRRARRPHRRRPLLPGPRAAAGRLRSRPRHALRQGERAVARRVGRPVRERALVRRTSHVGRAERPPSTASRSSRGRRRSAPRRTRCSGARRSTRSRPSWIRRPRAPAS